MDSYAEFKAKGVEDIYVVSINDMFVMRAWGEKLKNEAGVTGDTVKFGGSPL